MKIRVVLKNGDIHLVEQDMAEFKETLTLMHDIGFITDVQGWQFRASEVNKFRDHEHPETVGETRKV